MERKRRCGWLPAAERSAEGGPVWISPYRAEGAPRLHASECPVNLASGEIRAWLDEFLTRQALGDGGFSLEWPARKADAFALLESELRMIGREGNG